MNPKLFVGNLSFETTDEELRALFEAFGPVESASVVIDKRSGRSKGYGFVLMVESKDAARSLELNGREIKGRDIVVTEAESQSRGNAGGKPRRDGFRGRNHRGGRGAREEQYARPPRPEPIDDSFPVRTIQKKSLFQKLFGWIVPKPSKPAVMTSEPRQNNRPERSNRPRQEGGDNPHRRRRYRPRGRRAGGPPPSQGA